MSIDRVFVIGAGLMGHGIAQVSAAAGKSVTLSDRTAELAEKGKARIAANLHARSTRASSSRRPPTRSSAASGPPRGPMARRATTS